jgi:hypothetical protein
MAFTLPEVFSNSLPATERDFPVAYTTVVITQEDGRTAFGENWFFIDHQNRQLRYGINNADPAFDLFVFFSDRQKFSGNADQLGVEITEVGDSGCQARFVLKSWGNPEYRVDYVNPVGRLYVGNGIPIGNATFLAMYSLAFSRLDRQEIVIL